MWISNPLVSPLFLPAFYVGGGLLGGGLLALLLAMGGNLRRLGASVLFRRWRVWALIAPLYAGAVAAGPLPFLLLVSFLVWQGLREYTQLTGLPRPYRLALPAAGLLAAPAALVSPAALGALPLLLLLAATLLPLAGGTAAGNTRHLALAALGWGYLAGFLAYLVLLYRDAAGGPGLLLVLGLATALSDIGAFTVGKLCGRHPLAPAISPQKTWEGVAGNVLGAVLGTVLLAGVLPAGMPGLVRAGLPLVIAAGALWGDLLESRLKRDSAVKDAGTWLPGFGGLLDRIDSLILVAPLVFYYLRLSG